MDLPPDASPRPPDVPPERPLLGLCMIVKNEAAGIAATLHSIRPFIDRWTILDTGSTDDTKEIIRASLAGVPGELHEGPFVDFSTAYNRVLELHGRATEFALMLKGDDILINGTEIPPNPDQPLRPPARVRIEALRTCLTRHLSRATEALSVTRVLGTLRYQETMVTRTGASWRYHGRTHEVIFKPGIDAVETIPEVYVLRPRDGTPEQKRERWTRDLELLAADIADDPTNARPVFYLAQTYECLGQLTHALCHYEKRIELAGWADETYEAAFRRGRCLSGLGLPWPLVQQAYLDAYALDPRRAEPLFAIAQHWYDETPRNDALTYLFASRAAELAMPATRLFIEAEIYQWRAADLVAIAAYHLHQRTGEPALLGAGRRAADRALAARPGDPRLIQNRSFYPSPSPPMARTARTARTTSG